MNMAVLTNACLLSPILMMILLPCAIKSFSIEKDEKHVTSRKPFRVFWNVPHRQCVFRSPKVDMNAKLAKYGIDFIEASSDQEMGTEGVSIFYGNGMKWPQIINGKWINGGLPQYADIPGHLAGVRKTILQRTLSSYSGLGVIDMESFRPILYTNFGRLRFLREVQFKETARLYPNITSRKKLVAKAIETYERGARIIMEATLKEAIKLRPNMKWGYYGYPDYALVRANNLISWLWNATTAYYPSLYIYNRNDSNLDKKQHQKISETYRVRAKYGDPYAPIYPYHVINHGKEYYYNETLHQILDATIKKGVDGIVIWGSSFLFHSNAALQCKRLISYLDNFLGPQILRLQKEMTVCSHQLCGGHGRCVSQFYVGKTYHILNSGSTETENLLVMDLQLSETKMRMKFLDNYACQCYKTWAGPWCSINI